MIAHRQVQDVAEFENPHGVSARKLHDSEHAQVIHLVLEPGEALRKHLTPVDVCFYGLEGSGRVEIGDEQVRIAPDTLVESPAKIPHRLINDGEEPLRFLVIKTPRPTSQTRLL